jgi:hypothetical protein
MGACWSRMSWSEKNELWARWHRATPQHAAPNDAWLPNAGGQTSGDRCVDGLKAPYLCVRNGPQSEVAPQVGLEPTTLRLTARLFRPAPQCFQRLSWSQKGDLEPFRRPLW